MTRSLFAAAALLALAAPAAAEELRLGDLTIAGPYGFETVGASGAGYMTVTNAGDAPAALLSASSDMVPRVELHTTEVDSAGVARMIEQKRIEIPPGETVTFEPGGLHVMFMGLEAPLTTGDRVPTDLVFEQGEITVEFVIEPRRAGQSGGHGG